MDEIIVGKNSAKSPFEVDESDQNEMKQNIHKNIIFLQHFLDNGIISGISSLEKLESFDKNNDSDFHQKLQNHMKETHQEISDLIAKEKPDLIIIDNFLVYPCVAFGKIPWATLISSGPLCLFNSPELPPFMSGYPTNDRTGWKEFREKLESTSFARMRKLQDDLNQTFGYPCTKERGFIQKSPFMNIYGYPDELDYGDVIEIPENMVKIDTFARLEPEQFEFPAEFKAKLKPEDRLIYLSMGSMCAIDVELMKKLCRVLSQTPYKVIVSKGPAYDQYELPDNMWGKAFLPQTKILPMVDMVMTHGGNNTVTEAFMLGKPMLVMPMFGDQYDNAQRIAEKGYGLRINAHNCGETEMIECIEKLMNDKEIRDRCRKAAERIQSSNSKEKACIKIEQLVAKYAQS
ncbi:putative UDP-glucosyltransferase YojK [Sarcoptes scabiei]|uniref:Putative UDP-glucosyltransferase YojK n=1 Tax=Sarcoptes scabiei TaxID=52283 RepID=A0A834RAF5_SARSC|nr:putative UDP-glucosyltransferase YojK [Sarcoptes scabiei]